MTGNDSSGVNNIAEEIRSRRKFLKIGGGVALAGATLAMLPWATVRALAQATDIIEKDGFPASGLYTSKVFNIGDKFSAIGIYWEVTSGDGTALDFQVRTSTDGTTFGDWMDAEYDGDGRGGAAQTNRVYGNVVLSSGQYVQYQVTIPAGTTLSLVGVSPINNEPPRLGFSPAPPNGNLDPAAPRIISRAEWGANEAWRYSGSSLVWPLEYRTVQVQIVHHSETSNIYNADPSTDVRSIYYYHAITKGWGDIGYNYLIDWKGNIYEGRYGGDGIVGGHAYQYNYGSIGICLIGSFKSVRPTDAQLQSLTALVTYKCNTKNINPNSKIFFVDRSNVATISGHRDVINTTCPGQVMYDLLPTLRNEASKAFTGTGGVPRNYSLQLLGLNFTPTTLMGGQALRVDFTVKNTGDQVLETQGPDPGYTYDESQNYLTAGFPKVTNKFRVVVDFGAADNNPYPYRWGFGKNLNPGEIASVTGYIKMNTKRVTDFYGGVIQEYVKYHVQDSNHQPISVIAAGYPTQKAPSQAGNPNVRYFSETGHNLGYGFRTYWERNGGLSLFGFPLTEEFSEVSPTDGKVYTVQYFERNRFEYHPENKGTPYEVLLGLLGSQVAQGRDFPKVAAFTSTGDRWFMPQTSHSLGGVFLKYWLNNGGLSIFGYPISEEFQEKNNDDGKTYTVQYFERNRFEYHPENAGTKYEVLLGLLGKEILRKRGWLQPGL